MAQPKATVTKAQSIRDEIKANPKAKTMEIVKALADKGIKVIPNQVYALKALGKAKKKRAAKEASVAVVTQSGMPNPVEAIVQIRALAAKFGGIKKLKQIVDLLAE